MTRREEPWHVVIPATPHGVGWLLRTGGFSGPHALASFDRTLCGLPLPGASTGLRVQHFDRVACPKCLALME
jgi:hypothetical protein